MVKKYNRARSINFINSYTQYVRYADDLLIGVVDPRKFAICVQKQTNNFIKSNLQVQEQTNTRAKT